MITRMSPGSTSALAVPGSGRSYRRLPNHVAVIPDGNRRWAQAHGWTKERGFEYGVEPGLALAETAREVGIRELSFFGFSQDNMKRPNKQAVAIRESVVECALRLVERGFPVHVIGQAESAIFPDELRPYLDAPAVAEGAIKVNALVNYSWRWDVSTAVNRVARGQASSVLEGLGSRDASRIELVVRSGGRRRLSGLLPLQAAYADFFFTDVLWPEFTTDHFHEALEWYQPQEITLGG